MISFFVPGLPKPGGSKRAFMRPGMRFPVVTEDCTTSKEWRADCKHFAQEAMKKAPLLTGPVLITAVFIMPRPKGHYGTGKNARILKESAPLAHTNKPDALKLMRSTEDAMNGVVWEDDSGNVVMHLYKFYGAKPGVFITIEEPDCAAIWQNLLSTGKVWMV